MSFGRFRRWLLLNLLGQYARALAAQGKIPAADEVLDLMDGVSGWCSPQRTLDTTAPGRGPGGNTGTHA